MRAGGTVVAPQRCGLALAALFTVLAALVVPAGCRPGPASTAPRLGRDPRSRPGRRTDSTRPLRGPSATTPRARRSGVTPEGRDRGQVIPQRRPVDRLVLLWYQGAVEGSYTLQEISVSADGTVTAGPQVPLPTRYLFYSGPVATSEDSCIVVATRGGSGEVFAYQWRLGDSPVCQIGGRSARFRYGWPQTLLAYSRVSGSALVAMQAPEGMLDPPMVWVPGTENWKALADAYPVLRKAGPRVFTTATYSPDGTLLAVGAAREEDRNPSRPASILLVHLTTGKMQEFTGPHQFVRRMAISADNAELRWRDSTDPWRQEHGSRAGLGVLSLRTGRARYRRFAEEKVLMDWAPDDVLGQYSADGKRRYHGSDGLVCLDISSGRWERLISDTEWPPNRLRGLAVMPAQR